MMKKMKAESAREKLAEAEKALQRRSFFKVSPDYQVAESRLKAAALDFKLSGEIDSAIDCLTRAADCAIHNKDKYTAATHFEAAAKLAQSKKTSEDEANALDLFEQACNMFSQSNNVDSAVEVKFRIGRSLYQTKPDMAAKYLLQAAELIDTTKAGTVSIDVFALALNTLVKLRRIPEALAMLKKFTAMCKHVGRRDQLFKNNLTQTILMCAMGDFAGANEAFMDHIQDNDYLQQAEAATAEDLIEAFSKHDAVLLKKVQDGRGFRFLENEVAKFAISMKMEGQAIPTSSVQAAEVTGGSSTERPEAAAPVTSTTTHHDNLESFVEPQEASANASAGAPALPNPSSAAQVQVDVATANGGAVESEPVPAPQSDEGSDSDDGIFA